MILPILPLSPATPFQRLNRLAVLAFLLLQPLAQIVADVGWCLVLPDGEDALPAGFLVVAHFTASIWLSAHWSTYRTRCSRTPAWACSSVS